MRKTRLIETFMKQFEFFCHSPVLYKLWFYELKTYLSPINDVCNHFSDIIEYFNRKWRYLRKILWRSHAIVQLMMKLLNYSLRFWGNLTDNSKVNWGLEGTSETWKLQNSAWHPFMFELYHTKRLVLGAGRTQSKDCLQVNAFL